MKNLTLVMRFQAITFLAGLILFAGGVYGLVTYTPIPSTYVFDAPPYQYLFWVLMVLGAYFTIRAWSLGAIGQPE